ncbi:MAG: hypothetical protein B7Z75_12445 [Acidocella sp. 20-57-95]|nr:MAG: hypothetical protein B7Z75_12445 [Acidocella sp. 20-57-95]HQT65550.1 Hint domain-containing protein [Acidocella sp.]HQU04320.1 Hint domain-containing protein [Acidocella sp.]
MSGTKWTAGSGTSNWFTTANWSNGVIPVVSNTGTLSVTIPGTIGTQPVISEANAAAVGSANLITVTQNNVGYADVQVDGQFITLTTGAVLTVQGVAFGHLASSPKLGNIANLTAASSPTANYDKNMVLSATGADTLITNYVNHNFGLIEATGAGNSLNITIQTGGVQTVNGLYNYGEILAGPGASVNVTIATPGAGSSNTFGNAGYIVVSGGTFATNAVISDGANVPNKSAPDGYISIGGGGTAILLGAVSSRQEVLFTDTLHNTLTISNNNGFAGNVSGFAAGDTIAIAGLTSGTTLGYSGSLLTVGELSSTGAVTHTVTINVGTSYASAAAFGALLSKTGVDIQAPATSEQTVLTFSGTSGTIGGFEDPTKYVGGLAPTNNIFAGETIIIAAGTAGISSPDLVTNNSTIIVSGSSLIDNTSMAGTGFITLQNGAAVTLANSIGTDSGQTVVFGAGGTSLALNTLELTGSTLGFDGTIKGFGLNDDIILGGSVLPSVAFGSQVSLAYAGSLLTVAELNSAGAITASSTLDVGTGYSSSSFVALLGTNGVNIETAATVIEAPLTFTGTAGTISNFEDPTKYLGHKAPGSTVIAGETIILNAGTASITSTSAVNNSGNIIITGTNTALIDDAVLGGTGNATLINGGQLTLVNATGTDTNFVTFGGGGSAANPDLLVLNGTGTSSFGGTIANFGSFDTIVLGTNLLPGTETSFSTLVSGGVETLTVTSSVSGVLHTEVLHFAAAPPGVLNVTNSAAGIVISDVPCFAAGTRILTRNGYVAVESLQAGDAVLTIRDGREQKIVWTGQRTVDLTRHAHPEKAQPVRIMAGAFGDNQPMRDLVLSPDHALYIDGHLIEAKTLVNGVTIIQEKFRRSVTYHHIELARHDVVLADGQPAETFLDSGNRNNFAVDAQSLVLHADFAAQSRKLACAPLAVDGDVVLAVRQRLLMRAEALGFTRTDAIDLHAVVAGALVKPQQDGNEFLFVLPYGAKHVELRSATGVPADISAEPFDRRQLGVAIAKLALVANGQRFDIPLNDAQHEGFYEPEGTHRWTNGCARIALPSYSNMAVLEVTILGQAARWADAA